MRRHLYSFIRLPDLDAGDKVDVLDCTNTVAEVVEGLRDAGVPVIECFHTVRRLALREIK